LPLNELRAPRPNRDRPYWTQAYYRTKFRSQNPLRQNYMHARTVQELLDFLPRDAIRSVVVFTGDAEFKTTIPDGVFTLEGFLAFVEANAADVVSVNRVQFFRVPYKRSKLAPLSWNHLR
jgi:Nuclease-related domain